MDRRSFLRGLIGGVAAAAAVRSWPFRVFSFPGEIKTAPLDGVGYNFYDLEESAKALYPFFPIKFNRIPRTFDYPPIGNIPWQPKTVVGCARETTNSRT